MNKPHCLFVASALFLACVASSCDAAPSENPARTSAHSEINWLTDYDAALKFATSTNKLVVIDFYATWCGYCKLMDRRTFTDSKVQERITAFVPLKIDTDKQPQLAAKYGIEGLPTMLVVDATGKPITGAVGFLDSSEYLSILEKASKQHSNNNADK